MATILLTTYLQEELHVIGHIETVTVQVPPGARNGDRIRFGNLGDNGNPNFPRGDLHVKLSIINPKNWDRDNNNLIHKKQVNVFDLLTGCVIIITTLDRKNVKLNIPKGTKPGTVFNIPGYGVPDLNTGKRGNLYIGVEAQMPNITDENILAEIASLKNKIN